MSENKPNDPKLTPLPMEHTPLFREWGVVPLVLHFAVMAVFVWWCLHDVTAEYSLACQTKDCSMTYWDTVLRTKGHLPILMMFVIFFSMGCYLINPPLRFVKTTLLLIDAMLAFWMIYNILCPPWLVTARQRRYSFLFKHKQYIAWGYVFLQYFLLYAAFPPASKNGDDKTD